MKRSQVLSALNGFENGNTLLKPKHLIKVSLNLILCEIIRMDYTITKRQALWMVSFWWEIGKLTQQCWLI